MQGVYTRKGIVKSAILLNKYKQKAHMALSIENLKTLLGTLLEEVKKVETISQNNHNQVRTFLSEPCKIKECEELEDKDRQGEKQRILLLELSVELSLSTRILSNLAKTIEKERKYLIDSHK